MWGFTDLWGPGDLECIGQIHADEVQAADGAMRVTEQVREDRPIPWAELTDQQFLPEDLSRADLGGIGQS